jgi:hypothetical protein
VALKLNVLGPTADGVPLMTPVVASRARPAGRGPVLTDQEYGAVPPTAAKVMA